MVLCAYVDMLNLENHMKGHHFFRQAGEIAIEVNETNKTKQNNCLVFLYRFIFVFMTIRFLNTMTTKMTI